MSRSAKKRAFGSLRRLLRASRPGEQEWLRLILLVRRIQHGQVALVRRLDDMHALTGVAGTIRSDFHALHEQLGAARESAGDLERVLTERLEQLQGEADPSVERADVDRRVAALDALVARVETLAGQAPAAQAAPPELDAMLARFGELATRIESAQQAERAVGGQDELAKLYERIGELAEGLAPVRRAPDEEGSGAPVQRVSGDELDGHIARLAEQLELLEDNVRSLGTSGPVALEERLDRLERVAARLDRRARGAAGVTETEAVLGRFAALIDRLERAPTALPDLPADTITSAAGSVDASQKTEELRAFLLAEREARRQSDEELRLLRDRLRSSELARMELETRHASELTQMADHVQRQLARVEDDLKKKKRGMAELTQQNITLQAQLTRLQGKPEALPEPPPALPRGASGARGRALDPDSAQQPGAEVEGGA